MKSIKIFLFAISIFCGFENQTFGMVEQASQISETKEIPAEKTDQKDFFKSKYKWIKKHPVISGAIGTATAIISAFLIYKKLHQTEIQPKEELPILPQEKEVILNPQPEELEEQLGPEYGPNPATEEELRQIQAQKLRQEHLAATKKREQEEIEERARIALEKKRRELNRELKQVKETKKLAEKRKKEQAEELQAKTKHQSAIKKLSEKHASETQEAILQAKKRAEQEQKERQEIALAERDEIRIKLQCNSCEQSYMEYKRDCIYDEMEVIERKIRELVKERSKYTVYKGGKLHKVVLVDDLGNRTEEKDVIEKIKPLNAQLKKIEMDKLQPIKKELTKLAEEESKLKNLLKRYD